jgi:VWFA-related protein
MRVTRLMLLALLSAAAAPVHGQGFFTESIEIRVTNVEAIVTTKDGKPVTGLQQEDFEIWEDGVEQEISNFEEVREGSAGSVASDLTAATRARHITLFIDDATLQFGNRNTVLRRMRQFLENNVRDGDSVTIFAWSSGLATELEPTSDRARIAAAMDRLETRAPRPDADAMERFRQELLTIITTYRARVPPEAPGIDLALSAASFYGVRRTAEMQQKAEALKSVIAAQRGLEARKILLFVTESLTTNAAEEAFMFVESIADQFVNGGSMNAISEARSFELTNLPLEIAAAANSAGVTLYPLHAGGRSADVPGIEAFRSVHISGRGTTTPLKSTPTLLQMAADTGGFAVVGSGNWEATFATISSDLNTYYSLGYRNKGERQDRVKKVEVRLKDKRLRVRTRNSVVEQTASTEMSDAVAANLFRPPPRNDLAVRASFDRASTAGDTFVVTITIPTESLTLVPEGTDLAGNFSVFAAFLRQDGVVSRVAQQNHRFRFPAESLPRRKELTVKLDVNAEISTNAMSIGVVDETSRTTGFATVSLLR